MKPNIKSTKLTLKLLKLKTLQGTVESRIWAVAFSLTKQIDGRWTASCRVKRVIAKLLSSLESTITSIGLKISTNQTEIKIEKLILFQLENFLSLFLTSKYELFKVFFFLISFHTYFHQNEFLYSIKQFRIHY
jgi:hypothetical protein